MQYNAYYHYRFNNSYRIFVLLLKIVHFINDTTAQNYLGDACTFKGTYSPGHCKFLQDCQESLLALQQHQILPQTCGFHGTQPIVCCRESSGPSSTRIPNRTTYRPTTNNWNSAESISKQKCQEYAKYVYTRERPPILLIDTEESERNECGFQVVELIVGGERAKRKEFPHMAILGYQDDPNEEIQWLCGGSIISERFILTAAHCVTSNTEPKYVRVGIANLNDDNHMQQIAVTQRIVHPQYKPPSHYYDIALLRLQRDLRLNPYARPACIFNGNRIPASRSIATGWGKVDFAGDTSENLLKVTLDLIDTFTCNRSYRNQISRKLQYGIVENLQICAGSLAEDKDTCQGDSGGPLQIYHKGDTIKCMYDIVGITSFGKACGNRNPGVYTKVSAYTKWIEENVWPRERSFS